jgi:hypothetical protein
MKNYCCKFPCRKNRVGVCWTLMCSTIRGEGGVCRAKEFYGTEKGLMTAGLIITLNCGEEVGNIKSIIFYYMKTGI